MLTNKRLEATIIILLSTLHYRHFVYNGNVRLIGGLVPTEGTVSDVCEWKMERTVL